MNESLPLLATAFVTGLLGSAHCFGMCAGLSGLFAVNATAASLRSPMPMAIAYNAGRISSYAFLGIVVAALGQTVVRAIPDVAAPVRLASGLLIVVVGLQVAFGWRVLAPVENAGARIWKHIAPAARGLLPVTSLPGAFGLGLLWGWLPCGLVYSVLLLAATTASAISGGLVMLAFGVGTMPAMIMTGISASKLARFMSRKRLGAGLLIVLIGVLTLAMPVMKYSGGASQDAHTGHMMKNKPGLNRWGLRNHWPVGGGGVPVRRPCRGESLDGSKADRQGAIPSSDSPRQGLNTTPITDLSALCAKRAASGLV